MAKDRFYRTKPHVNVGSVMMNLMSAGFTADSASQIANGLMPISPAEQQKLLAFVQELANRGDIAMENIVLAAE